MHFVCTAYTVSACALVIGFTTCIVSTHEYAFPVTADRKIYHARQKILSEVPNFFSPYTGNPPPVVVLATPHQPRVVLV